MKLFVKTPIQTVHLQSGLEICFKLDYLQPSASFKDRGIGHMIETLANQDAVSKLICSSGGNAGHAVATAGKKMNIPVDVYVPVTTIPMMVETIKTTGAKVHIGGNNWNEADAFAQIALTADKSARYIPPFDHPLIWEGVSKMVDELVEDLGGSTPPDAIILSVGGGGLLSGVLKGLERVGWNSVHVLAVETEGAASFAAAKAAGKVVKLDKISTIATTLGALAVTQATLDTIICTKSVVVSDADAVYACLKYADEFKHLVEPACGAALSVVYRQKFAHLLAPYKKVVVVVCGGSAVNIDLLLKWKETLQVDYP